MSIDDTKALIVADESRTLELKKTTGELKHSACAFLNTDDGWVWGERPHTFHGCPYYKVESTTKVMPHEMYDERIRAHKPQMYAWERITTDDVTFVVFGNNLLGHRNLFNHILRYNTIHYHTDSIAN